MQVCTWFAVSQAPKFGLSIYFADCNGFIIEVFSSEHQKVAGCCKLSHVEKDGPKRAYPQVVSCSYSTRRCKARRHV